MTWTDVLENPAAIHSVFDTPPSLGNCSVKNMEFKDDGPSVHITFRLNAYPSRPPHRWARFGANAATMELRFFGLTSVDLRGWGTDNVANTDMTRSDEGIIVTISGPETALRLTCGWAYVVMLEPYTRAEAEAPSQPTQ